MKIKLHEIELGAGDLQKSRSFYHSALGLPITIDQPGLKVFDTGVQQLDLNCSQHLSAGSVLLSFICDDIEEAMLLLSKNDIDYEGPTFSHLGMISISFQDPSGNSVKINQATDKSPEWLKDIFNE